MATTYPVLRWKISAVAVSRVVEIEGPSRGIFFFEDAVITGDLMHHPVKRAEPAWASRFDVDSDTARRTRRAYLERYANRPVLVLGTHFATPTGGCFVPDGKVWRFAL